jgi:uncharacterized protein with FMN-binding domain
MKRIALSLAVIAGSAAYVLSRPGEAALDEMPVAAAAADTLQSTDAVKRADPLKPPLPGLAPAGVANAGAAGGLYRAPPPPAPVRLSEAEKPVASDDDEAEATDDETTGEITQLFARVPLPRLRASSSVLKGEPAVAKARAPVVRVAAAAHPAAAVQTDGTFTGSVENAYYGLVQVEAQVTQGKLVNVKVLRYPSDRRTSVYINSRALPALRREAISAQSANVDIISGATLTSRAFVRSLDTALNQASL